MFDDTLPAVPKLLNLNSHDAGFDAEGIWIKLPSPDKPPLRINRLTEERKLFDLDPPFVHVVHDMGPHAPYGFENGVFRSTKEFFKKHERKEAALKDLYAENCRSSGQRFIDILREVEDRGLLDQTLLVFTSDHGEALGEDRNGGRFGHGHPLTPETVRIPIVFCGAGLPEGVEHSALLSGTDIVPTILSALGESVDSSHDGIDIWTEVPDTDRLLRSEVWQHLELEKFGFRKHLTIYCATSAWNQTGGRVFHRKSTLERALGLAYDNLFRGYSPAWKANVSVRKATRMAKISIGSQFVYGTPEFSIDQAREVLPEQISGRQDHIAETLNDDQLEHLKDMGYL